MKLIKKKKNSLNSKDSSLNHEITYLLCGIKTVQKKFSSNIN